MFLHFRDVHPLNYIPSNSSIKFGFFHRILQVSPWNLQRGSKPTSMLLTKVTLPYGHNLTFIVVPYKSMWISLITASSLSGLEMMDSGEGIIVSPQLAASQDMLCTLIWTLHGHCPADHRETEAPSVFWKWEPWNLPSLHSCYTAASSQRWACRHWTDVFQIRLLDPFFVCFLIHSPWIERSEILFERWLLLVTICCHISKELSKSNRVMTGIALRASPKCETYLIFRLWVGLLHVGHHRQHCGSSFSVRTCVCGSRSSSSLVSTAV